MSNVVCFSQLWVKILLFCSDRNLSTVESLLRVTFRNTQIQVSEVIDYRGVQYCENVFINFARDIENKT